MQSVLAKMDSEREGLVAALGAERLKRERLEHLIAVERTRKIQIERGVLVSLALLIVMSFAKVGSRLIDFAP